ncbi:sensor histidine kinase [Deinococcus lacus]|uniref:histidine kinase n=1 Tax=Deinococcus lacus TaxID=392561 RepID=A0ABW1YB93_9DEIO
MVVHSSSPLVFVVTVSQLQAAMLEQALAARVPGVRVRTLPDAAALLRESHQTPPQVVVGCPVPGLDWREVLPLLRGRAELAATFWLGLCREPLGAADETGGGEDSAMFLQAGVDALSTESLAPAAVAEQVARLLDRAAQLRRNEEAAHDYQRRISAWEHEERVRDQLVHMLVHDLKNPITAILGLLEVVEEDVRLPGDLRDLLGVARDETQHLLHLSLNMLDVRKIQAGKMNLKHELLYPEALAEIIRQAQGDVGAGLSDRRLSVQVAPDLPAFNADPQMVRRVMANLLSNALKHTTARGQIEVRAAQVGGEIQVSVRDDGEGIPAEDIPRLFAAFEQSRLTLHGRFDTGMGLAFCKLAVEQHGGRIWVDSVRGQGSTFTFTLPVERQFEDDFVDLLV